MFSLVIFDLDGTLIDSKADICASMNRALISCGFPPLADATIEGFVGRGLRALAQDCVARDESELIDRITQNFWADYDAHLLDKTVLYQGVKEFLETYKQDLAFALVTNKPLHFSKKILEGLQIAPYFSWVIGGDSLSIQKPDPEVLAPIFSDLKSKPKGLFVGDSEIDILCGKAAGLSTCAVTYGYRSREELEAHDPDFVFDDFSEIHQLLRKNLNFMN